MAATWRGTIERGLAESGAVTSRFSFELVYDAVAGSDPVTVLIGHSMGSVVAYEWLHTPASAHVGAGCLFLTLGSPLGSYPIARRLRPSPAFPGTCEQWVNVASRHDPIAWPKQLRDVFGPPLIDEAAPFRAWAHSAHSYLRAPATVRVLSERLSPSPSPRHPRPFGEGCAGRLPRLARDQETRRHPRGLRDRAR
ncbi:alpha/beta fold hydrolase [Microbispora sp. H10836]|uniref:alpha/beta fold hydrolase n=1 Tax=Microbispora sp. H10836 TaxID=2729106 RepID=UPI001474E2F2|nr:alpha/beta fold hydrolase [Microbispora sp. H10836]